jgi:phosphoribosylformylglycinamidine cyclo-ligase
MSENEPRLSYAAAGVDIEAGDRAVELIRASVARAGRPEVIGGIGGFAGMFDASALRGYRRPVLVTATDGVGTKVEIARRVGRHDTVGIDMVAMVVDDLVVCGAEPLFLTDYIACGKLVPELIASIVAGVAEGCVRAGVALLGGETAEHPGVLAEDQYDLAGAGTGVVEADRALGPERVRTGDAVLALASSGLHSNGYSLVRRILDAHGWPLAGHADRLGRPLGAELMEPTRIYSLPCLRLARELDVHAFAHVTGGGIAGNLARVLPAGADAEVDRSTWTPPAIFTLLDELGGVGQAELERTFNLGIGMLAVLPGDAVAPALEVLAEERVPAWVAGRIVPGTGEARLVGRHPAA